MKDIVIIGGGAAGLLAALYTKNQNSKVTILERNAFCGKKILSTGNGKCNYWNDDQDLIHYHSTTPELIKHIITKQNQEEILNFFSKLGIYPKIKNGYYYPFSNQATTIKNELELEIKKRNIEVKTNFLVEKIKKQNNKFEIYSSNEKLLADKVIIATGSKAAPKTGSDGIGYELLKSLGHSVINPLPALVQLKTTGTHLKEWAGIRTDVIVSLYEDNKFIKSETGEIQLTDYGISGICVFNLSHIISRGLENNKEEIVKINFLPFILDNPITWFDTYIENLSNKPLKEILEGILNNKLVTIILKQLNITDSIMWNELTQLEKEQLLDKLTNFEVKVLETKSFENAQVCTGGIPLTEINTQTMESKIIKNLYIIGELLDVDGDCGGYNLSFAWISGMLAGCDTND